MTDTDERELPVLVADAVDGDELAWVEIVHRMENMVWSVVRSFRLSDADSRDAAQMVWLRVLENLHRVTDPERLGIWIATIARRECMRLIEKQSRLVPSASEFGFDHLRAREEVEDKGVNRMEAQQVLDALGTLSVGCQELLRLVLCDPPMSYKEISASLGIAVGTIGARRQRCLSRLRAASGL